jgi:hypothetical protein
MDDSEGQVCLVLLFVLQVLKAVVVHTLLLQNSICGWMKEGSNSQRLLKGSVGGARTLRSEAAIGIVNCRPTLCDYCE